MPTYVKISDIPLSRAAVATDKMEVQATEGGVSAQVTAQSVADLYVPSTTLTGGVTGSGSGTILTTVAVAPLAAVTGLGTGVATFLATPSSANLAAALTDETGSGANVFATSPTLVTPNLGVASADAYKLSTAGFITDATTSRTLSAGDNGVVLYFTSASAVTLSMAGSLGAFSCTVLQGGAGKITFAANSQTLTVAGSFTKTAYVAATALILSPASGTFLVSGTLA